MTEKLKDLLDKISKASPSGVNGTYVAELKDLAKAVEEENKEENKEEEN